MRFGNRIRAGSMAMVAILSVGMSANIAAAQDDELLVIGVLGPLSDPFFSTMKKGGDDAAAATGVTYEFTAPNGFDNLAEDLSRLIEVGIARQPDAMVIGNFIPDAESAGIKAAVDAGITVVVVNSGADNWEELGAIAFVGQDERLAGVLAAEAMVDAGVEHGMCVNHVPGNPGPEARCAGFEETMVAAGFKATVFNLPYSDSGSPERIAQAITGMLRSNSDIGGVFTLGSGIAESAMQAVADGGFSDNVLVGTTDVSTNVLEAVKAGDMLFVLDQQSYVQGYYGVLIAAHKLQYGLQPIGTITTGPLLINADNVEAVLAAAALGVRGAQ